MSTQSEVFSSHGDAVRSAQLTRRRGKLAMYLGLLVAGAAASPALAVNWTYGSGNLGDSTRVGPQFNSTPAIGIDGSVYVISDDFRVRAITPGTTAGTLKWVSSTHRTYTSQPPDSAPAVASDGTIWFDFLKEGENCVYALNHVNGSPKHQAIIASNKSPVGAPAIDVNDWAVFVYHDCVVAFGAKNTGGYEKKWSHVLTGASYQIPTMPALSTPAVYSWGGSTWTNQLVYWAETHIPNMTPLINNRIFAMRQMQYTTGTVSTNQAWVWNFPGGSTEVPVGHLTLTSANTLYVIGKNGSTHKLYSLNGNTGAQNWAMTLSFTPNSNPSLGLDGTLYVPCTDGVRAINPATQTIAWTHFTGTTQIKNTPVVGADGSLYFAYDVGYNCGLRRISSTGAYVSDESFTNRRFNNCPVVMDRKGWLFVPSDVPDSPVLNGHGQLVAVQGVGRPAFSDWPMWGRGYSRNNRAGKTWRAVNLGILDLAGSGARGLNEAGAIAGYGRNSSGWYKAAHTTGAGWTELFPGVNGHSYATGVNDDQNYIAYRTDTSPVSAYRYTTGSGATQLSGLSGGTIPWAINNSLRIVGYSYNSLNVFRAVMWNGASPTRDDVGSLIAGNDYASAAYAVSSSGRITGESMFDTSGKVHAFLTGTNGIVDPATDDLETLGGDNSYGFGINDAHEVVGMSQIDDGGVKNGYYRAFYKPLGPSNTHPMQALAFPSGTIYSRANDINNCGLITGYNQHDGGGWFSYYPWVGRVGSTDIVSLNYLADLGSLSTLLTAWAVNDRDEIVGQGLEGSSSLRGYVLRPND